MDLLFPNFLLILSIKEVLVEVFCTLVNYSQASLHMYIWLLEEVGNHSCGVHLRPDSTVLHTLHLRPHSIGDFSTWSSSKMLLKQVLIIIDFLRACSIKTESKLENNMITFKQI